MKDGKIPDDFFKNKIDYCGLEDNIYNQLSRTMARAVDIDFAKTPIIDILTGYTRYIEAEKKVDQLEKENKRLKEWKEDLLSENVELENIRKEVIESIEDCKKVNGYGGICTIDYNHLLNILNKGSDKE